MPNLGNRPFGEDSHWLVRSCEGRYRTTIIGIFMMHPDFTELQVGNAMMDIFEPDRLSFDLPVSTEVSWTTSPWQIGRDMADRYLHVAKVPYFGTKQLWRLYGAVSGLFKTRLALSEGTASLKLLMPDRDVETFRAIVADELELGRQIAATQDGAITWFRTYLHDSIETLLKHHSIDHLREEAERRRRIIERENRRRREDALSEDD